MSIVNLRKRFASLSQMRRGFFRNPGIEHEHLVEDVQVDEAYAVQDADNSCEVFNFTEKDASLFARSFANMAQIEAEDVERLMSLNYYGFDPNLPDNHPKNEIACKEIASEKGNAVRSRKNLLTTLTRSSFPII